MKGDLQKFFCFVLFYARINYQFKTSKLKNVKKLVEQIFQVLLEWTGNKHYCTICEITFLVGCPWKSSVVLDFCCCRSCRDVSLFIISLILMIWTCVCNLFFFSIITAKFPDTYRLFVGEESTVHYLAILNADDPDMFVLIHVDEQNDTAVSWTV